MYTWSEFQDSRKFCLRRTYSVLHHLKSEKLYFTWSAWSAWSFRSTWPTYKTTNITLFCFITYLVEVRERNNKRKLYYLVRSGRIHPEDLRLVHLDHLYPAGLHLTNERKSWKCVANPGPIGVSCERGRGFVSHRAIDFQKCEYRLLRKGFARDDLDSMLK